MRKKVTRHGSEFTREELLQLAGELQIVAAAHDRIFKILNGRARVDVTDQFSNLYGKGNSAYNKLRINLQADWRYLFPRHPVGSPKWFEGYDGPFDDWNSIRKVNAGEP